MEKEKKKNNSIPFILFLIAICLFAVSLFFVINNKKDPLQSIEFDVEFEVIEFEKTGINVNNTVLKFGKATQGGPGINRLVNINNEYPFMIRVDSFVSENIQSAMVLNSSYFVEPFNNVTIRIKLSVPLDFEIGNYSGKIRFDLYEVSSKK